MCAHILNLQLRTLPLESGSAEQVMVLSLWAHSLLVAHRYLLASAVDVIPTAALAVPVLFPAPLAEELSLISRVSSSSFPTHRCWPEHGAPICSKYSSTSEGCLKRALPFCCCSCCCWWSCFLLLLFLAVVLFCFVFASFSCLEFL